MLFGLTTSGRSANVVRALAAAREMRIGTVGLLGGTGEPAIGQCDHVLLVPDGETARVQECHVALGHAILELLEDRLKHGPSMPGNRGLMFVGRNGRVRGRSGRNASGADE